MLRPSPPPAFSRPAAMVLAGLVVAKLALHLLTATGYGLHRDEFLYLEMGHHLAWGYKEVPPALAPLAALSRWFGESPAFVRLWPALFGAATVGLVGWLVRELRGGWWATLAAGLATAIAPVYLVMHHLFQPSFLEVFWWTLYGCLLVRFRHGPSTHLLVAFGVAVGLGMLAKYGTVFYVLALVPAALLDSVLRPWLWSRGVDEGDEAAEVPDVNAWFRQAEVVGRIQDPNARCRNSRVWLLRGPKSGLGRFVRRRVAEARAGFDG